MGEHLPDTQGVAGSSPAPTIPAMFIKICGITEPEQANKISNLGATHIGVVFFEKSPRHISLGRIEEIKASVKKITKVVAVVVNPDYKAVENLLNVVDIIQFHGNESIEFLKEFPKQRVIKAFRLKSEDELRTIEEFVDEDFLILIDSFSNKAYGGTGKQIDVELAKKVRKLTDRFILSGGLSPENLAYLIEEIRPFGVDASSRLEISPGIKDLDKVKNFIDIARKNLEEKNK